MAAQPTIPHDTPQNPPLHDVFTSDKPGGPSAGAATVYTLPSVDTLTEGSSSASDRIADPPERSFASAERESPLRSLAQTPRNTLADEFSLSGEAMGINPTPIPIAQQPVLTTRAMIPELEDKTLTNWRYLEFRIKKERIFEDTIAITNALGHLFRDLGRAVEVQVMPVADVLRCIGMLVPAVGSLLHRAALLPRSQSVLQAHRVPILLFMGLVVTISIGVYLTFREHLVPMRWEPVPWNE